MAGQLEAKERVMPKNTLARRLRDNCNAWESFTGHAFVNQMRAGELPTEAYKAFLIQDYLFLKQLARAWCLVGYKADSLEAIEHAADVARNVVQMEARNLHVKQCARWGITESDLESASEAIENTAYTRFLLDCGLSGDTLDLLVAMAPCALGYAEIGVDLWRTSADGNCFSEWIGQYSGEEYLESADSVRELMEREARKAFGANGEMCEERMHRLQSIWDHATMLEAHFWSMALRLAG